MIHFWNSIWNVLLELAPWLLLGAFIAGLLHVLLPKKFLRDRLTGSWGVLRAVGFGVPLPLCSCGVIPVGLSLKFGGASHGAVVGFLISTPQTGVDSILVSASLLGWPFALFKLISATITGLIGGWLTDAVTDSTPVPEVIVEECGNGQANRFRALITHAIDMIRSVWRWLVIGVLVSAGIEAFMPTGILDSINGYGGLTAMILALVISIPLYVCATASVPIAAALVAAGLPAGAALVFLMAGPATNVATLGAVYRSLGSKPLAIYLTVVILGSIGCGLGFGWLVDVENVVAGHEHLAAAWWNSASAIFLCALVTWFAMQDVLQLVRRS